MYKLPYYAEDNKERILAFMQKNSFAVITGKDDTYPVATHVPLDVKMQGDKLLFTGHIMKNTDHHKAFMKDGNVLVIFNGPHCYVSASWYNDKQVGSTWNYITVHAKGKIAFHNEIQTRAIVEAITNKYEKDDSPAAFQHLSDKYIDRLVKAIIGFTIEVESVDNVFKLSQNHEPQTRESIIKKLFENGSDDEKSIAHEMQIRMDIP